MLPSALLSRRAVAGAVVVLSLSAGTGRLANAGGATTKPKPCARAKALKEAGYLKAALAAYRADLGQGRCAIEGVRVVKSKLTKRHTSAQAKCDATPKFKAAVVLIRRLEAEGFEADARTKTKELLTAYPACAIPKDIRAIDQPVGWWRRQQGRAGPVVLALAELAIVVLGGLLVVLVAAKALVALVRRLDTSYTVADVTGPVAGDAAGQGDVLAAALARIAGQGGAPVRRVQATEGDFRLPAALTAAYPQAGVIAALLSVLDRVLPRRLLTISAAALPVDPIRGVGVTVTITKRGGRQLDDGSRTLWESEFGPVDADGVVAQRLARLMLPAAVWVGYRRELVPTTLIERARALPDRVATGRRSRLTGVTRLGTTDWLSYAHFAVAERAQRSGDTVAARRGYFRALDVSLENIGARLNLAGLLLYRRGDAKPETDADRSWRLSFAAWLLQDPMMTKLMPQADVALRWRWMYLRAARALAECHVNEGAERIEELCDALASNVDADAAALASEIHWPAFVLRRSILLAQRSANKHQAVACAYAAELDPVSDKAFKDSWWTANTLYNLACYYARAAACDNADEGEAMRTWAHHILYKAIDRAAEPKLMLAMATCDPALDDIVTTSTRPGLETLAGITAPTYEADEQAGHALGVRIRKAITAALSRSKTTKPPAS